MASDSPLLSLPPELRNRIHRLVLVIAPRTRSNAIEQLNNGDTHKKGNIRSCDYTNNPWDWDEEPDNQGLVIYSPSGSVGRKAQPSLLQVNTQIRREASGIYYNENIFTVFVEDFDAGSYLKWCSSSDLRRTCKPEFYLS